MRICLISKEYPPETGWGGIGAYTFQIAQGLKEIGHDVEVVSLMGNEAPGNHPGALEPALPVSEEGILVHRARWRGLLDGLSALPLAAPTTHQNLEKNLALWLKFAQVQKASPFDVVEAPEHLCDGYMPALTKSVPLVIKLHTPQAKLLADRYHNLAPSFDQYFIALSERMAMLAAEVLISPSEDMADWVAQDLKYARQEIRIVRNPVDAEKFCPEGLQAIAPDGRATVLFVGRLEERKGIIYLIRAIPQIIKQFANVRFVIVGADTNNAPGQSSTMAQLKGILAESGCSDHVTFVTHVSLDEMPAHYRSADICVAPSLYDNAPYTCIEAMSCGRAFVGTSAGGMREYLVDGESGIIVPPADENALAQAILKLLQNEQYRDQMGKAARERVLQQFHRTAIARDNIGMYELAIERFKVRRQYSNYRGSDEEFLVDAMDLIGKYDRMLYDMLFVNSWRFKMRHWGRKLIGRIGLSGSVKACAAPTARQ